MGLPCRGLENRCHFLRNRQVADKGTNALGPGKMTNVDELVKAQQGINPVTLVKTGWIRVNADRSIPQPLEYAGEGRYPHLQLPIRVELVYPELRLAESGQKGEFRSHSIGAPCRDLEWPRQTGLCPQRIELFQHLRPNARKHPPRVKKRLTLDRYHMG